VDPVVKVRFLGGEPLITERRMHLTRRQFLRIAALAGVALGVPSAVEAGYATGLLPRRVVLEKCPIRPAKASLGV
jgi:hypothetical protein